MKEKNTSRPVSAGGIALLVLALILAVVAWKLIGGELTRARVNTAEGLEAWRASRGALADVAFNGGQQVGSFVLVEEAGKPPRIAEKGSAEGQGRAETTLYRVWELTGAGYQMLYCESVGMKANPERVGRRYASLGGTIAAQFAPDMPYMPVFFAEPVREVWQTALILGMPILTLLLALKKLFERE